MKRAMSVIFAGALSGAAIAQAPSGAAPTAPARIAVIELDRVARDSAAGKEVQARLKKLFETKGGELERRKKELQDIEQKVASQTLSDEKRDQLNKDYQEKQIDFKSLSEKANREFEQAQRKEEQDLLRRIVPVIEQVGKERGYALIFNKYQSGLVFADDAVDITSEVLKRFNTTVAVPAAASGKPATGAAAPQPPAAKPATSAPTPSAAPVPTKKPS